MCGIVGYLGNKLAMEVLLDGLTRLEYRGYDSAGIATLHQGKICMQRSAGKLSTLKKKMGAEPLKGDTGIGHTRWATHGRPTEANAHPHCSEYIAVVHNGIIENHLELRKELQLREFGFTSETDTEVLGHLFRFYFEQTNDSKKALEQLLQRLQGSYALVVLNGKDPERLWAARSHSPLVLGLGEKENFVASDVPALLPYTRKVIYLKDGEYAEIRRESVRLWNSQGQIQNPSHQTIEWDLTQAEKCGFKHFMLKEIEESPRAVVDTLRGSMDLSRRPAGLQGLEAFFEEIQTVNKIELIACGTSYHAALVGKFYLEKFLKIPVSVDVASEFRYRDPLVDAQTLLICISQSGETADSLIALKNAKAKGTKVLSICNVVGSSIPRESHAVFYTHAGPEIGVAATKTFITQLEALFILSLNLGLRRKTIDPQDFEGLFQAFLGLPSLMEKVLQLKKDVQQAAQRFVHSPYFLFIGRGLQYPIALEGALKLKEISYIASEGYAAGELKHGPIAMIDEHTPVIALAPQDASYEKMASNIEEVLSRGASLILVTTEGTTHFENKSAFTFYVPPTHPCLYPLLTVILLQLLAYEIADLKGIDVDQPRNLAKSVTVE